MDNQDPAEDMETSICCVCHKEFEDELERRVCDPCIAIHTAVLEMEDWACCVCEKPLPFGSEHQEMDWATGLVHCDTCSDAFDAQIAAVNLAIDSASE
jgi:hypothetical protein